MACVNMNDCCERFGVMIVIPENNRLVDDRRY